MKKQSLFLALSAVLLLSACSQQGPEAATATSQPEKVTPVQVEQVKTGSVVIDAGFSAKLAPSQEVQISPKASGKITSLPVKLGQYVSQGQVLFRIDEVDLANSLKQAEASYQFAQANLRQAGDSSSQGLEQAKNSLKNAEVALKDAQLNQQRMQQLFSQGAISSQQFEQANIALANAQTAYDNARKTLQTSQQMSSVQVSQASVAQAAVSVQAAKTALSNAVVTAPISGFVSSVTGEVGQFASPSAPVLTIVNTNPLKVKANVSEQDITQVKVGTSVNVEVTALAKTIEAKVTAVSPVMDASLKAYPVEISIPNAANELKSDMVVNVKFNFQSKAQDKTLVISRKAIFEQDGVSYVYKLQGDVAKKVEVKTGEGSSELMQITSGLQEGDQIVVKGQTLLKDGGKVKIQN